MAILVIVVSARQASSSSSSSNGRVTGKQQAVAHPPLMGRQNQVRYVVVCDREDADVECLLHAAQDLQEPAEVGRLVRVGTAGAPVAAPVDPEANRG